MLHLLLHGFDGQLGSEERGPTKSPRDYGENYFYARRSQVVVGGRAGCDITDLHYGKAGQQGNEGTRLSVQFRYPLFPYRRTMPKAATVSVSGVRVSAEAAA